jgi:hypothetical protein
MSILKHTHELLSIWQSDWLGNFRFFLSAIVELLLRLSGWWLGSGNDEFSDFEIRNI